MKKLLIVTAVIELGAGLTLLGFPSVAVAFLLNPPLDQRVGVVLGRVAGAALFALSIANWLAHYDEQSCAARGVVTAMVLYNLGAAVILAVAGIQLRPVGFALWPAVALHASMTIWCVARLRRKPTQASR